MCLETLLVSLQVSESLIRRRCRYENLGNRWPKIARWGLLCLALVGVRSIENRK